MLSFAGTYDFAAPRAEVWAALNDPAVLQATIPGCKSLERESEADFHAVLGLKFGLLRFSTTGALKVEVLEAARSYRLHGHSAPTFVGSGKGTAEVTLCDLDRLGEEQGTHLIYSVEAELSGRLAKLGANLVSGQMQSLGTRFFKRFEDAMDAQKLG